MHEELDDLMRRHASGDRSPELMQALDHLARESFDESLRSSTADTQPSPAHGGSPASGHVLRLDASSSAIPA